ncbi:hypothetical protein BZZ01_16655 [Nostocales cyanobacterium HT-58-2]|nr:hypothetical protein BZZ01_16655 [Nostocales cyanobacterium HT-58-2]
MNGRKAYCPVLLSNPKQILVTVHTAWSKPLNGFTFVLGYLTVSGNPRTSPDCHVCHQVEFLLNGLVDQRLDSDFVSELGVCVFIHVVAGICKRLKSRI